MAKFRKAVITSLGLDIISAAVQGIKSVELTKVVVGNGAYTGSENLESFTSLVSSKNTFNILSVSESDNNTVKVRFDISNEDVLVGYNLTEIGLFAKNESNQEVLFAITSAIESDYFPDHETAPASILTELYIKVSNSDSITFSYTVPTGVYASAEDVDAVNQRVLEIETNGVKANGGNAATVNNHNVNADVPANAKFTDTTYEVVSTSSDGLAPKRDGSTTKFLRADGTWAVPPDTNTTYGVVSTSANGLAPKRDGSTSNFLRGDGTWAVPSGGNADTVDNYHIAVVSALPATQIANTIYFVKKS